MDYFLTLDMGTTSLKASIFDSGFHVVAETSIEYLLSTPSKNVVEMDVAVYWDVVKQAVQALIQRSGVDICKIVAITCTTQGETLIPIDKNGSSLGPAIVWFDARAQDEAAFFADYIGHDLFYKSTGIPEIGSENPICKLKWYKDKLPQVYNQTFKFLLLEDYLVYKLTGKLVTNRALIGTTGYYDINQNTLFDAVFKAADLDCGKIPDVIESGEIIGRITPSAACELGLSQNTIVVSGAIDQVCTAIGAGNVKPGVVSEVTGTCLVIAATTDTPDYNLKKRMTYLKHFDDRFLILPYCVTAGIILKWFKDNFCDKEKQYQQRTGVSAYDQLTKLAELVPVGSDGLVILPHFAGKLSPDVNPDATGVFYGVGLQTTKGHMVRAIMESVAYMLRENLEYIESTGLRVSQVCSVGGGAKSKLWNQIKADVCGKEFCTCRQSEAASLGAAILGAAACGYYDSVADACAQAVEINDKYVPINNNIIAYKSFYELYCMLYKRLWTAK